MTTGDDAAGLDLEAPWRRAFELAWASYAAGSLGIGAVVTDTAGSVVAAGRNRLLEAGAPPGQVAGSAIAHAEVNALAGVPLHRRRDLVLWTTLEPCLLCTGAVVLAGVPDVRFAGPDPLWDGIAAVASCTPFVTGRWPNLTGPRRDRWGALGALLPLARFVADDPGGPVAEAYGRRHPDLTAVAEELVRGGELDALVDGGAGLPAVAAALLPRLPATP